MQNKISGGAINAGKFKIALDEYVRLCQKENADHTFKVNIGKRFMKVVHDFGAGDCVFCFVEISTGDLHKGGTWHQPQPNGKRGNIFTGPMPLTSKAFYIGPDRNEANEIFKHAPGNCAIDGHVPDGNGFCFRCGDQLGVEFIVK